MWDYWKVGSVKIKTGRLFDWKYKDLNENDIVFTPERIAKFIIKWASPKGFILDPCAGEKVFYNNFPTNKKDWCEITDGKDFYSWDKKIDWIISNPPYSDFDRFLEHSFSIANNIVYLTPFAKIFKSMGTIEKIFNYGGIVKILIIPANRCGFPFGFPAGAFHFAKNYKGDTKIRRLNF